VFAQEHGITTWTLYYWRKRLARQERPARRRPRRVTLAPVHLMTAAADAGDLEIVLVSGDRVRVSAGASVETLSRVVQTLRTAC
jgi:hypothetical protein